MKQKTKIKEHEIKMQSFYFLKNILFSIKLFEVLLKSLYIIKDKNYFINITLIKVKLNLTLLKYQIILILIWRKLFMHIMEGYLP